MLIYDTFLYNNEDQLLDIRLNILDKFVHKFVIVESKYTHSGNLKKLNFEINNFKNFKDKIIYIYSDKYLPPKKGQTKEWFNENFQRNYIEKGILDANENDLIMVSDLDEIPKLENINFNQIKNNIVGFMQKLFLYKLNFCETRSNSWLGTKMCKKKLLKSPQWIRNLKLQKKYPFYRFDKFYFSKDYTRNFMLVEDGGWHFSWVGDIDYVKQKILNTAHQELNTTQNLDDNFLEDCINNKKPLMYDGSVYEKINYQSDLLPNFIRNNFDKFKCLIG